MDKFAETPAQYNPVPWPEFRDMISQMYKSTKAPATTAKVDQVLRICDSIGLKSTSQLTNKAVLKFVESLSPDLSKWTKKSLLSTLRAICSVAYEFDHIQFSPFTRRKMHRWVGPLSKPDTTALTAEQIRTLLDLLARDVETRLGWAQWRARRLQAVIATCIYTGLRKNEALYLHASDVDLTARIIHLVPREKPFKTPGSAQPVGVPAALVPILADWFAHRLDAPFGYPLDRSSPWLFPTVNRKRPWVSGHPKTKASTRVRIVGQRAGIDGLCFQIMRRSLATHMERFGVGGAMISRQLRHSDEQTTERHYRRADLKNIAEAVREVDF